MSRWCGLGFGKPSPGSFASPRCSPGQARGGGLLAPRGGGGAPSVLSLVLSPARGASAGWRIEERFPAWTRAGARMWAVWWRVRGPAADWRGPVVWRWSRVSWGLWFWRRWRGHTGLIRRFPVSSPVRRPDRGAGSGRSPHDGRDRCFARRGLQRARCADAGVSGHRRRADGHSAGPGDHMGLDSQPAGATGDHGGRAAGGIVTCRGGDDQRSGARILKARVGSVIQLRGNRPDQVQQVLNGAVLPLRVVLPAVRVVGIIRTPGLT